MFEELEKELQQEQGVDQGVDEQSTSQDTTSPETERQPDPKTEKPKINLDEIEDFRAYKSAQDKRIAQLEKAHREQLRAEQQRREAYERQLEEKSLAGMDDYQKLQYRLGKVENERNDLLRQRQQDEIDRAKFFTLQEISRQTGIPIADIADTDDPSQAWALGTAYMKEQLAGGQRQQQQQDKRERNQVDVGGGRTAAPADDLQARYDRAMKQYDTGKALEIMHEADMQGITLKFAA
jgi:hypothetical protein